MNNHNGARPIGQEILGVEKKGTPHALAAFVRSLDANGNYDAEKIVAGPNGMPMAIAGRSAFVDAEELVEMIRLVVREELRALKDG